MLTPGATMFSSFVSLALHFAKLHPQSVAHLVKTASILTKKRGCLEV